MKETASGPASSSALGGRAAARDELDDVAEVEVLDQPLRRSGSACVAGLSTTALPACSAGASFQVGIAIGKFHGVISSATPRGTRTTRTCAPVASSNTSPAGAVASEAA